MRAKAILFFSLIFSTHAAKPSCEQLTNPKAPLINEFDWLNQFASWMGISEATFPPGVKLEPRKWIQSASITLADGQVLEVSAVEGSTLKAAKRNAARALREKIEEQKLATQFVSKAPGPKTPRRVLQQKLLHLPGAEVVYHTDSLLGHGRSRAELTLTDGTVLTTSLCERRNKRLAEEAAAEELLLRIAPRLPELVARATGQGLEAPLERLVSQRHSAIERHVQADLPPQVFIEKLSIPKNAGIVLLSFLAPTEAHGRLHELRLKWEKDFSVGVFLKIQESVLGDIAPLLKFPPPDVELLRDGQRIARYLGPYRGTRFPEAEQAPRRFQELSVGRTDLRHLRLVTIDPPRSPDVDDALSIEPLPDGGWRLGVHIADPTAAFSPGPGDDTVWSRGYSYYGRERYLPMMGSGPLEAEFSLHPQVPRLALSLIVELKKNGAVAGYQFFRSIVQVGRALSYDQAYSALANKDDPDHELLSGLRRVGRVLSRRHALEPEGFQDEFVSRVPLVQEPMILANRLVAEFLESKGVPYLSRVHQPIDAGDRHTLESHFRAGGLLDEGESLTDPPVWQRVYRDLYALSRIDPDAADLIGDLLGRARYGVESLGHSALGLKHYSHFTSPLRRYADWSTARQLSAVLTGQPVPYTREDLEKIADHMNRLAAHEPAIARQLLLLEALRRRLKNVGQRMEVVFVGQSGGRALIQRPGGRHTGDLRLPPDWILDINIQRLVRVSTGESLPLGARVRVTLRGFNLRSDRMEYEFLGPVLKTSGP